MQDFLQKINRIQNGRSPKYHKSGVLVVKIDIFSWKGILKANYEWLFRKINVCKMRF